MSQQTISLQWGRNFRVAERWADETSSWSESVLQWGRNFRVAERAQRLYLSDLLCTPLQWGRNFRVAESSISAMPASAPGCFNGAATLGLRKVPQVRMGIQLRGKLQWGRNFRVAESYCEMPEVGMYPRLQWGRNFRVAESVMNTSGTPNR